LRSPFVSGAAEHAAIDALKEHFQGFYSLGVDVEVAQSRASSVSSESSSSSRERFCYLGAKGSQQVVNRSEQIRIAAQTLYDMLFAQIFFLVILVVEDYLSQASGP
jgi:hypothetical protein